MQVMLSLSESLTGQNSLTTLPLQKWIQDVLNVQCKNFDPTASAVIEYNCFIYGDNSSNIEMTRTWKRDLMNFEFFSPYLSSV